MLIPEQDQITEELFSERMFVLATRSGDFSCFPEPGTEGDGGAGSARYELYRNFFDIVRGRLTQQEFKSACHYWCNSKTTLPSPKDLLDVIKGNVQQRAIVAWDELLKMSARNDYDYYAISSDAFVALLAIGDIEALNKMEESKRSYVERDFIKRYETYASVYGRATKFYAEAMEVLEHRRSAKVIAAATGPSPQEEIQPAPPPPEVKAQMERLRKEREKKKAKVEISPAPKAETPQSIFISFQQRRNVYRQLGMEQEEAEEIEKAKEFAQKCDPELRALILQWAADDPDVLVQPGFVHPLEVPPDLMDDTESNQRELVLRWQSALNWDDETVTEFANEAGLDCVNWKDLQHSQIRDLAQALHSEAEISRRPRKAAIA